MVMFLVEMLTFDEGKHINGANAKGKDTLLTKYMKYSLLPMNT